MIRPSVTRYLLEALIRIFRAMITSRRHFLSTSARAAAGLAVAPTFASILQSCTSDTPVGPTGNWVELANALEGTLVMRDDIDFARLNTQYALAYLSEVPEAIALCESEADVVACVKWARANKVKIVPRSGGHSYAGYSRTTGLIIDLSQMSGITYDAATQRATLQGGAHNKEVYVAGRAAGTSITHGRCKAVGAAGLILGGGIGFNMRNKGLTCDGLVSTRMVLANGDVITASATENPDVFWAVRGAGGGNFGIHTQFVVQMFPVTNVTWFRIQFNVELERIFDVFQDVAFAAPPEFGCKFMLNASRRAAEHYLYVEILGQMVGDEAQLRSLLKPVYDVAAPSYEMIKNLPYWDAQEYLSEDGSPEYAHERTRFAFDKISAEGRDTIFRYMREWPGTSVDAMWKYFLMGGRIKDVPNDATAFPFRNATMISSIDLEWQAPDSKYLAANFAWLDAFHAAMEPYTSRNSFINFVDRRETNYLEAYYGNNLERLRAVKRQLDPGNVFSNPKSVPL